MTVVTSGNSLGPGPRHELARDVRRVLPMGTSRTAMAEAVGARRRAASVIAALNSVIEEVAPSSAIVFSTLGLPPCTVAYLTSRLTTTVWASDYLYATRPWRYYGRRMGTIRRLVESPWPGVLPDPAESAEWVFASSFIQQVFEAVGFAQDGGRVVEWPVPPGIEPLSTAFPDGSPRKVLYAGRIIRDKGLHVLLGSLAKVGSSDWSLTLAGPIHECDYWEGCKALVRQLPPDRVTYVGNLDRKRLASQVDTADIIVVPSVWPEPFPFAVLEGAGAGRLVVASRTGGIPEAYPHQLRSTLLFERGDERDLSAKLESLMISTKERRRLANEHYGYVTANFGFDSFADRVNALMP